MKVRREYLRDGKPVTVTAERLGDDLWRVQIGQNTIEVTAQAIAGGVKLTENGAVPARSVTAYGAACDNDYMVRVDGRTCVLSTPRESGRGRGGGTEGAYRGRSSSAPRRSRRAGPGLQETAPSQLARNMPP